MKALSLLVLSLFFLIACTNSSNNTTIADTATAINENIEPVTETLCFQRVEGSKNQDTSSVRLVINGNDVTGNFLSVPYEKDSRKGTIQAVRQGDVIKGLWLYTQEGMQDTLSIEFKLDSTILLQKNYSINEQGRQFLNDKSSFITEFKKIDCAKFPGKSL